MLQDRTLTEKVYKEQIHTDLTEQQQMVKSNRAIKDE